MKYLNYLVQGGSIIYEPLEAYYTQRKEAENQERRFLAKARALGATIFEDCITVPGTPEEQQVKAKELLEVWKGEK